MRILDLLVKNNLYSQPILYFFYKCGYGLRYKKFMLRPPNYLQNSEQCCQSSILAIQFSGVPPQADSGVREVETKIRTSANMRPLLLLSRKDLTSATEGLTPEH